MPGRLAATVAARPLAVVGAGLAVGVLAGVLAASSLEMRTARIDLVGEDIPFARRLLDLEAEFGDLDAVVVAIRGPDQGTTRRYTRELAGELRQRPDRFRSVFYRVDPHSLGGRALLFLTPEELSELDQLLARGLPELRRGGLVGSLHALAAELRYRLEQGQGGRTDVAMAGIARTLLEDTGRALSGERLEHTALDEIPGWDTRGYTWSGDGQTLILLVSCNEERESDLDPRAAAVESLRELTGAMQDRYPDVEIGLTGKPVLNVDEMRMYRDDSLRASLAALIGVTLLLVLAFRQLLGPLLMGACLAISVVLTLGLASLWPGHLNLMAVVFVVVVIGLGVDFGLHLITRMHEELDQGRPAGDALRCALERTGPAIVAGGLTTAGAFFTTLLTDFKGLREFGVVAGLGVLASLLVMLTVLPALTLLVTRPREVRPRPGRRMLSWLDRLQREHPGKVLLLAAVLSLGAATQAPRLSYDANLLNLQSSELASVQLEWELMQDPELSSWFLAYPTKDLDDLARVRVRVNALPGVRKTESVLDVLPPQQEERLPHVRATQERVRAALTEAPDVDAASLREALEELEEVILLALDQGVHGTPPEALAVLEDLLELVGTALENCERDGASEGARAYDRALSAQLRTRLGALAEPPAQQLTPERLPPDLRDRLVGRDGTYMLRIYPEANLWDPVERQAFLDEVRTEIPEVTGIPVLLHESSAQMARGYLQAGGFAFAVVVLFLLVYFRSLSRTLLAVGTLLVGGLWLAGAMAVVGIDLNPANLVALPLLLGIGVDTTVHVMHRIQEQGPRAPLLSTSLGRALLYSGLTSVAGFGSLMLADHPGTATIGSTISLGVLCCLLAGLMVPPAVLRLGRGTA